MTILFSVRGALQGVLWQQLIIQADEADEDEDWGRPRRKTVLDVLEF